LPVRTFAQSWSWFVMTDELKKSKPKVAAAKVAAKPASVKPSKPAIADAAAAAPLAQAASASADSAAAEGPAIAAVAMREPVAITTPVAISVPAAPKAPSVVAAPSVPASAKPIPVKTVVQKSTPAPATAPRSASPSTTTKEFFTMTTTTAMTDTIQTAMKDAAEKAKTTMEKSQAAMGDMSAFAKGNVEAVVEAGKILASGMQEMSKGMMTDSKSVVETMTAEMKDLAAVKSPAEFFEKQSAMMRKQFDAAVAASSKNSEAMLKLASEAFQPISNRVSLAVEKIKHAA